jgi:hypothetical protein
MRKIRVKEYIEKANKNFEENKTKYSACEVNKIDVDQT